MIYEVDVWYNGVYTVQVESEDKDTAEQKAIDCFEDEDWPTESCPHLMSVSSNEYTKADYKKDVGV